MGFSAKTAMKVHSSFLVAALQVLRALREETALLHGAHLQVSPDQGQFMGLLVELLGVRTALEVGVFTGYSAAAVALVGN
jgi:O-methyltransferase